MGFDVSSDSKHIVANNIDDCENISYDILGMPNVYGINCPQLDILSKRFYDSTTVTFKSGAVHCLKSELLKIREAYKNECAPQLAKEKGIRSKDQTVYQAALDRALLDDRVYQVISDFILLCDEAITHETDVQCEGD